MLRLRLRPALTIAIAVLLVLLLLAASVAGLAFRDAVKATGEMQGADQDLRNVLHSGDFQHVTRAEVAGAATRLDDAAGRLRRDQRLLTPALLLARPLVVVPLFGRAIGDAPDLLTLARDSAEGGAALAHGLDPVLAQTNAGNTDQNGAPSPLPSAGAGASTSLPPASPDNGSDTPAARFVQALDAGAPALQRGDVLLHRAMQDRAKLHPDSYRGPLRSIHRQLDMFDRELPLVLPQADGLALLPDAAATLFGFHGRRTFVVLGQDSAELRPTGGFIGSAGLITLDEGRHVYQEYRSSYDFDGLNVPPLPPPPPLQQYLGLAAWYLRDANWAPDFPTTARQVLDFVQRDTGVQADGVIAFDTAAVTDLLAALGPLQVEGFSQPVTADNWFGLATQTLFTGQNSLASQLQDYQQAKGAGLGAVLQAALQRVQGARGPDLFKVVDGLRRSAHGNHLLLAFGDRLPAEWAAQVGIDGAFYPAPNGDVVAPVETNVSYSKVGPYVQRDLRYEVWLNQNARPNRAQLTLTYDNAVTADALSDPGQRIEGTQWLPSEYRFESVPGLYGDYLRVYVAGGAKLESPTAAGVTVADEAGYRVLSAYIGLGPQQSRSVTYAYVPAYPPLPAGDYRLTLYKQAGVNNLPVHVVVHVPDGMTFASPPAGAQVQAGSLVLDAKLDATMRLDLHVVKRGS